MNVHRMMPYIHVATGNLRYLPISPSLRFRTIDPLIDHLSEQESRAREIHLKLEIQKTVLIPTAEKNPDIKQHKLDMLDEMSRFFYSEMADDLRELQAILSDLGVFIASKPAADKLNEILTRIYQGADLYEQVEGDQLK